MSLVKRRAEWAFSVPSAQTQTKLDFIGNDEKVALIDGCVLATTRNDDNRHNEGDSNSAQDTHQHADNHHHATAAGRRCNVAFLVNCK